MNNDKMTTLISLEISFWGSLIMSSTSEDDYLFWITLSIISFFGSVIYSFRK